MDFPDLPYLAEEYQIGFNSPVWRARMLALLRLINEKMGSLTGAVITPPGTTGDITINARAGTVNFASGDSVLTITNSYITPTSILSIQVRSDDVSAQIKNYVCEAGQFTITLATAAFAETSVGFVVLS